MSQAQEAYKEWRTFWRDDVQVDEATAFRAGYVAGRESLEGEVVRLRGLCDLYLKSLQEKDAVT